ncbi:hypothetical protein BC936DRAFT_138138 [Jimgerdemannia flammicorona]|uniref:Uncharacterized protein n=1 Tax=Jimgerdemannia flammicorona TaxID=994334 RepID=A0A433CVT6_9FUNG|nr:hypothetical protein BC936DRAFT_138138 [Jimgerdemannia flammicorona]
MLSSSMQRLRASASIRSLSTGAFAPTAMRLHAHRLDHFPILRETMPEDTKIPSFMVGTKNGFLPRQDPMATLPDRFAKMDSLLRRMPLNLADGSKGLLANGQLGDAVHSELEACKIDDITDERLLSGKCEILPAITHLRHLLQHAHRPSIGCRLFPALTALYRDYTFLASAYLLEPCDIMYRKKSEYGLGRQVLPSSIAVPLAQVANKIGAKPFMEYALSYRYTYFIPAPRSHTTSEGRILYNWQRKNPFKGLSYDNLDVIRSFAGTESEKQHSFSHQYFFLSSSPSPHLFRKGFILNHVTMVAYSGDLIQHATDSLDAIMRCDRPSFNRAMKSLSVTYEHINNEMDFMWSRSEAADYQKSRTFIMGTKNQPMFPNGVIYEGVSDKPLFHRGESGANDSMIPLGDNLLQLTGTMPNNPLTEVLRDFRSYRPTNHKEFLEYVQRRADEVGLKEFALQDDLSAAFYLANVDQIRAFRHRHWNLTKEYILKYSNHPVATGGSPIVTWLPNQLGAVLSTVIEVGTHINPAHLDTEARHLVEEISRRANAQKRVLEREVTALKEKFGEEAVRA